MADFRTLGIIPARGGSKGVRRKNVRLVAGEPLIAHAIRAARESRLLSSLLTSTDDDEIDEIATRYGSPVVERPADLAQDDSSVVSALVHALEHAERVAGQAYDGVVLLQPTAPIRTGDDVDAVIKMLAADLSVDSVVSVYPVEDAHPARMYSLQEGGWLEPLFAEWERALRQEMPVVYHRNGALYACRRELLVERRMIIGERKKAYLMPRRLTANVDDELDLMLTDTKVRMWKEGRL